MYELSAPDRERVYPRACGGTVVLWAANGNGVGLSPRLRGNRQDVGRGVSRAGSIPAPAGEPVALHMHPYVNPVYPRACGGTASLALLPSIS